MSPMDDTVEDDTVDDVLEEVASTAEEVVAEQQEVAQRARHLKQERVRHSSWVEAWDRQPAPSLLERMRAVTRRLAETTSRLSRATARQMAQEGASRRAIARRLGVSHQRVTTLLNRQGAGPGDQAD